MFKLPKLYEIPCLDADPGDLCFRPAHAAHWNLSRELFDQQWAHATRSKPARHRAEPRVVYPRPMPPELKDALQNHLPGPVIA